MDFSFTDEQQEFRYEFRDWLEDNLPDGWIHGDWQLPQEEEERIEFRRNWQRKKAEDGWAGPNWPAEYGGMDLSIIEELIYEEELARINAPPTISVGVALVGPTLIEMGTDWQKERFISNILSDEELWCQGYSEPTHGSDVAGLETSAERDGDEFVINGPKIWTSYAHYADWCILLARTDFSGRKHEGITAFLVDMDKDSIQTERIHQINDDREFNQVFLDNVRVPDKHVVGEVDHGWDVIRTISAYEQTGTEVFKARHRFNQLLSYCQNQSRGGRPLAEHPNIRRKLAEFDTRLEAAKYSAYRHAASRIDDRVPGSEGTRDRLTSNEIWVDLEDFAMNLLGPEATLWYDGPQNGQWAYSYLYRNGMWIAGGTGDIYRNIIGEQVLGLPKDIKSDETHRHN
jgi:alkylation response protein AidB-like acyl-CoA dehydrogenase